jgi:hypothetical protein
MNGRRATGSLLATVVVGVVIVATVLAALVGLGKVDAGSVWTPVLQDVLKTGFQVLAVGALGGLAKLFLDSRRSHEAAIAELNDRQRVYIGSVVAAAHQIENARMVVLANRSVRSWTDQINEAVVPARGQLRVIAHDLKNWESAGQPAFDSTTELHERITTMSTYLLNLITEHAEHKQPLGEMQRLSEDLDGRERAGQLDAIWGQLSGLEHLGALLSDGSAYSHFRRDHEEVVRTMRSELAA